MDLDFAVVTNELFSVFEVWLSSEQCGRFRLFSLVIWMLWKTLWNYRNYRKQLLTRLNTPGTWLNPTIVLISDFVCRHSPQTNKRTFQTSFNIWISTIPSNVAWIQRWERTYHVYARTFANFSAYVQTSCTCQSCFFRTYNLFVLTRITSFVRTTKTSKFLFNMYQSFII